ncbi:S1C family serine protease [Nocardioides piscis]|uniref:PDZ domain-containing protein n=1 Tax=Nocardioides piscis TaxID=2714938 RepID=A0A6G7YBJ9_9ACTN|nr:trypsin-like peptidase domain-containing protein [Nocardioides piscis]QIK74140.1 PDZ domain-containing protein [Nocardioides piscis]
MSDHDDSPQQGHGHPETDPTQPISGTGWTSPSHSHPGASPAPGPTPIPPPSSPWGPAPSPGPMQGAQPTTSYAEAGPRPDIAAPHARRSVPGWTWPVIAALSLVLGLVGGFLGALGQQRLDDGPTTYDGGLDSVQTQDAAPLEADNGSVPAVAQALLPSTVQIIAAFEGEDAGATGSGFVLDRQGHIVTNNHVVASAAEGSDPIKVVDSEGVRHDATVIGRSPVYDLAILQVKDAAGLEPAALGSSRVLRIGDPVVAFGSPLGLSQTVTSGIVSALDRPVTTGDEENTSSYINAVQTDAAINPGNSGGPLVNLAGEVVGVNSAIATTGGGLMGGGSGNIGVGFAIPIEQVRTTADQILKTGEARYPVIGAQVRTGGTDSSGALITEVNEGTPAQAAGLRKDDVVTEVDGQPVTDGIALIVAIRTHQPGETIEFTVRRGNDEQSVEITLDGEVG